MADGRLTRKVGIVALGRTASTASVLAVNAILARAWSEAELGVFLAVWTVGNTLMPIFLLGLPTSLLYFFPRRGPEERKGLMAQTLYCLVGAGVLLVLLLYFLGPQLVGWLEPGGLVGLDRLGDYLLPFLPYVFSLVVGGFIESALVAAGAVRWQAGLALATAAGLVGTAWAGASLGLGGREVLLLFSGVGALRLAAGLGLVAWKVGLGGREDRWRGWREFMGYSLPVWLNDAVGSLSRYVDRFVVLCFFSAAVFSHYHLGAVEVPISLLLTAVVTVLVPEVSRLYREERLAEIGVLWKQAVGRLALIVVPFFCFLFVFAEPLIELYLTSRYSASRWVFRIFLLTLPLRCAVYNPLLVGMGMARWALWGSLGDLLLNTSLSIALVQVLLARQSEWAFLGPAVAAVMATYAQVLFLVGVIAHRLRWGLGQLLPWGDLLRIGVFSGLAAAAGWWVSRLADGSVTRLMLAAGGFGVALAGLLGSSAPAREELKAIFRGLGRG